MRVWLCPLWFNQVCPWCQLCLSPLSISVLWSPAEVNLRTVWRRQLLRITTPCRQPDLVASSTVVNGLSFGAVVLPYSKGSAQRMRPPESFIRSLGYPGSSLPSWMGLSPANLLYREDFPQSTYGVGMTLVQDGVVRPKSWQLEGVRNWKLSRTYPGEKPPSLSVLTHRYSLATRKPIRHLLAMPWILVRIGAPYEGGWST